MTLMKSGRHTPELPVAGLVPVGGVAIQALIAKGWSVRRIARTLGINRRTVKRYTAAVSAQAQRNWSTLT